MSLTAPEKARDAFGQWLRECLIDKQAYKVPISEGGWANGSLVREVLQVHQERGVALTHIEQDDPALVDEAIARCVRRYLGVFNSIRDKGYGRLLYPRIYCRTENGAYFIENGHHRVSALWALGHQNAEVVVK